MWDDERRLRGCELETDHVTSCDTPTVLLCELVIFHIHVCLEKSSCSLRALWSDTQVGWLVSWPQWDIKLTL